MEPSEGRQLLEAFDRLTEILEKRTKPPSAPNIRIDASGAAVWIATTACLVMIAMSLVAGFWVSAEFARSNIEREALKARVEMQGEYLRAIGPNLNSGSKPPP